MTAGSLLIVLAVVAGIVVMVVILARRGHPETGASSEHASNGEGPTGEEYPPGSRPAGPGAEAMSIEPSKTVDGDRDD